VGDDTPEPEPPDPMTTTAGSDADVEADTTQARSELDALLAAAGIGKVVFVDDANAQTNDTIDDVIAALEAETIAVDSLAVIPVLDAFFTEDGDRVDNPRAAELLRRGDFDEEVASAALEALAETRSHDHRVPDQTAISIVRDLLPTGVEYAERTLATWPDVVASLPSRDDGQPDPPHSAPDEPGPAGPPSGATGTGDTPAASPDSGGDAQGDGSDRGASVLVLIDRDFSNEGGRKNEGEAMVADLVQAAKGGSKVFVALVTHQFSPGDEEPRQTSIAGDFSLQDDRFVVISKLRLTDDRLGFVRRIGDIIAWTTVQQLTTIVISAVTAAYEEAGKTLRAVRLSELRRVLVHETKGDGVWETDQLLRMLHAILDTELLRRLRADDAAWTLTDRLRRVSPDVPEPSTDFLESDIRRLQRNEIYLPADVLNLGMGVDTGDIFRVVKLDQTVEAWRVASSERYFIVLEQNCNMVIREKGNREPEMASLTVGEVTLASIDRERDVGVSQFLLPMFCPGSGKDAIVALGRRKTIPWEALDATVWGPGALSETRLDKAEMPGTRLDDPWTLRHGLAVKRAVKAKARADQLLRNLDLPPDARTVFLRGLLGISWDVIPIELSDTRLRFGVQRIARLREPYATLLRAKSGSYQARQALEAPLMAFPAATRPAKAPAPHPNPETTQSTHADDNAADATSPASTPTADFAWPPLPTPAKPDVGADPIESATGSIEPVSGGEGPEYNAPTQDAASERNQGSGT
jgi:hypothetical protein